MPGYNALYQTADNKVLECTYAEITPGGGEAVATDIKDPPDMPYPLADEGTLLYQYNSGDNSITAV